MNRMVVKDIVPYGQAELSRISDPKKAISFRYIVLNFVTKPLHTLRVVKFDISNFSKPIKLYTIKKVFSSQED